MAHARQQRHILQLFVALDWYQPAHMEGGVDPPNTLIPSLTAVRDHQPKAKARSPILHSQKFRAVFDCIGGSAGLTWIKTSFELYHPRSTASPSKLQPAPAISMTSLGQPILAFPFAMVNPAATRVFGDDTTTGRMSCGVEARIRPSPSQSSRDSRHV
jgi:hypothetical protein